MTTLFPLSIEGAVVRQKGKVLLGPLDLTLTSGRGVTIVIGPNGSGKSTLLRLIHGILRLAEGQVSWACSPLEARERQALVFQTPILLRRSVADNIAYPLHLKGVAKADARSRALEMAKRVGIAEAFDRSAAFLSGGERQKLAIARALIQTPGLLLLDEPCSALDGRSTREIEEILRAAAETGTRIIMATHDMGQARRLADDVVFVLGGRVHEHAAAEPFFTTPQTREAGGFLRGDIIE